MRDSQYEADRRSAAATVSALNLPENLDFDGLTAIVQAKVDRELNVRRAPGLAGTLECGHTYRTTKRDVVLHAPSQSRYQEQYWVCHEFGHLILGHLDEVVPDALSPALSQVFDLLDVRMLKTQLARTPQHAPEPATGARSSEGLLELEDGEEILGEVRRSLLSSPGERLAEAVADELYMRLHRASTLKLSEPLDFGSVFG